MAKLREPTRDQWMLIRRGKTKKVTNFVEIHEIETSVKDNSAEDGINNQRIDIEEDQDLEKEQVTEQPEDAMFENYTKDSLDEQKIGTLG